MKFFVDTADVKEIRELNDLGLLDGVTTNPSLILKSGGNIAEVTKEICSIVKGPVSAEVVATEYGQMMKEAKVLAKIADNICIKVPLTLDGLKACRTIRTEMNRMVNVTLCFSANQALLAAKAGASFISPFVGRIDDTGSDGMELIAEIRQIYDNYDYQDRDPHGFGPHREPCQAGSADRRRRHHRAAGHAEGAGQPPADRQGAGGIPRRLGEDRPEDRLICHGRRRDRLDSSRGDRRRPSGRAFHGTGRQLLGGRRLRGDGEAARAQDRARRNAGRPQDRLHQPQYLGRIRHLPADLGRHVRHDGARRGAGRPGRGVATAGAAHRARNRARA